MATENPIFIDFLGALSSQPCEMIRNPSPGALEALGAPSQGLRPEKEAS